MATTTSWPTIQRLVAWLNQQNGCDENEISLRLLKLSEEVGEVAQAWIGATGQNPRKGVTHTTSDVADELTDVIVTAMVAMASISSDPAEHFDRKLQQIAALRLDPQAVTDPRCDRVTDWGRCTQPANHDSAHVYASPCHCGQTIPAERQEQGKVTCSDRCRWDDDNHGPDHEDGGES